MPDIPTKTLAMLTLAKLRRRYPGDDPDDAGLSAIVEYITHLERELAKFAPTHMAEVWRENERLKSLLDDVETDVHMGVMRDGSPIAGEWHQVLMRRTTVEAMRLRRTKAAGGK